MPPYARGSVSLSSAYLDVFVKLTSFQLLTTRRCEHWLVRAATGDTDSTGGTGDIGGTGSTDGTGGTGSTAGAGDNPYREATPLPLPLESTLPLLLPPPPPLPPSSPPPSPPSPPPHPPGQGLTLVHFSAQRKLFLWDTLGGYQVSVTKTALDELRSGRV